MQLTKRQAIFLMAICMVANKVQRLPSLISTNIGRHGYLVFLIMGLIDFVFLFFALWFNRLARNHTTYEVCEEAGGTFFAKIIFILFAIYFFANSILPFEAIHDLFANILFDHLSWSVYSLILVAVVLFLASRGLKNIGRVGEIFFYLIMLSFLALLGLGTATTNLMRVLPLADINVGELYNTCADYNLWFGDFIILYIFVGKLKEDKSKFGFPIIITFLLITFALSFTYMVFYGLYENLSTDQNSLISSISQFALLDLDIGRVDWFLVLFFQTSTVISSGLYLYCAGYCICKVFKIKKNIYVLTVLITVLYILDIFLFRSVQAGASVIASVTKYYGLFMIFGLPIVLIISALIARHKQKRKASKYKLQKYCFLVKTSEKCKKNNKIQKQIDRNFLKLSKKESKKC